MKRTFFTTLFLVTGLLCGAATAQARDHGDDGDGHWSGRADHGEGRGHEWRGEHDEGRGHEWRADGGHYRDFDGRFGDRFEQGGRHGHYGRSGRWFFDPPTFFLGLGAGALLDEGFEDRRYYSGGRDYSGDNCRVVYVTHYDRFGDAFRERTVECWDRYQRRWCPQGE